MKNRLKYIVAKSAFAVLFFGLFSCSDWTDPKSVAQKIPSDEDHPYYAEYLQALRAYKAFDHKVVLGWFDNSVKIPVSRAQHIKYVPDSVDMIVLMYPSDLVSREVQEMKTVKEKKAVKFLYTIDYDAIVSHYKNDFGDMEISGADSGGQTAPAFPEYLEKAIDEQAELMAQYPYDGIIFKYTGKSTAHIEGGELEEYLAQQEAFVGKMRAWKTKNPSQVVIFEGTPQYILDETLLDLCSYIIIDTNTSNSAGQLALEVLNSTGENVPDDRFIVTVLPYSKTNMNGHFITEAHEDIPAIIGVADWVSLPSYAYTRAGLGIRNISKDFYDERLVYRNTREAIAIMNPRP